MLVDLDELVLRCRDERAKAYIGEAVACYRAGAYRASIITTWIALAFDIVDKIRELSFAGDKAAEELTQHFETITRDNDLRRAQEFERQLLANARDRFELISAQEFSDLERLHEDRHRCAHPSRSPSMEIFRPTAELARTHLRAAVEHVLQHEPAQGKAAMEAILKTIDSSYFPIDPDDVATVLAKTPLRRARESLVRNLVLVLMKSVLKEDQAHAHRRRAALLCIRRMYPEIWRQTVAAELSRLIRTLTTDRELNLAVRLVAFDPEFGDALEKDQVLRLGRFIRGLEEGEVLILAVSDVLVNPGPLRDAAIDRVRRASLKDIIDFELFGLDPPVCDRVIAAYSAAASFDDANAWGKVIIENASAFSPAHANAVLRAATGNGEVARSFSLGRVLAALEGEGKFEPESAETLAAVRSQLADDLM